MENIESKDADVEASVTQKVTELPMKENETNRRTRIRKEKKEQKQRYEDEEDKEFWRQSFALEELQIGEPETELTDAIRHDIRLLKYRVWAIIAMLDEKKVVSEKEIIAEAMYYLDELEGEYY